MGQRIEEKFMDLRKKKIVATLVFPVKGDEVLLVRKTKKIGIGLWNGFGGGVEEGESPKQSAVRELKEEANLIVREADLESRGKAVFHNKKEDGHEFVVEVHLFVLRKWQGDVRLNKEVRDATFWSVNNLPFDEMLPSDRQWVPLVLSGKVVEVEVFHSSLQRGLEKPVSVKIVG